MYDNKRIKKVFRKILYIGVFLYAVNTYIEKLSYTAKKNS